MSEALTTSCSPALRANSAMMSSGALPKVTLSRPPMPGPERTASSSVARPMSAAVGITPSAEAAKIVTGSACANSSTTAMTMNGSRYTDQPEGRQDRSQRGTRAGRIGAPPRASAAAWMDPLLAEHDAQRCAAAGPTGVGRHASYCEPRPTASWRGARILRAPPLLLALGEPGQRRRKLGQRPRVGGRADAPASRLRPAILKSTRSVPLCWPAPNCSSTSSGAAPCRPCRSRCRPRPGPRTSRGRRGCSRQRVGRDRAGRCPRRPPRRAACRGRRGSFSTSTSPLMCDGPRAADSSSPSCPHVAQPAARLEAQAAERRPAAPLAGGAGQALGERAVERVGAPVEPQVALAARRTPRRP